MHSTQQQFSKTTVSDQKAEIVEFIRMRMKEAEDDLKKPWLLDGRAKIAAQNFHLHGGTAIKILTDGNGAFNCGHKIDYNYLRVYPLSILNDKCPGCYS